MRTVASHLPQGNIEQLRLADTGKPGPIESLAASFANFKIGGNKRKRSSKLVQKTKWVAHDRKKFGCLITEVKDLIDGLQDITKSLATVADQSDMMRRGINNLRSVENLGMLAEVCEADHPDLFDAASVRADTISMAPTTRNGIASWNDSIDVDNAVDLGSTDLESLTVTELKHRLWHLLQERQAAHPLTLLIRSTGYGSNDG